MGLRIFFLIGQKYITILNFRMYIDYMEYSLNPVAIQWQDSVQQYIDFCYNNQHILFFAMFK